MENHHFQWENPLFLWWIFNSYATNYQRVKSTITKARPNLKLHGVPQDVYRFHQQLLETSPFLRYVKHFDRWLSESPYQAHRIPRTEEFLDPAHVDELDATFSMLKKSS